MGFTEYVVVVVVCVCMYIITDILLLTSRIVCTLGLLIMGSHILLDAKQFQDLSQRETLLGRKMLQSLLMIFTGIKQFHLGIQLYERGGVGCTLMFKTAYLLFNQLDMSVNNISL